MLDEGLSLPAALRSATLEQLGLLMVALGAEVDRIAKTEPLDTVAALRVARAYRQLVPVMEMSDPEPEPAAEESKPRSLAEEIAAAEKPSGHDSDQGARDDEAKPEPSAHVDASALDTRARASRRNGQPAPTH
ncbi:MAG TPA: hypothetical protein VMY78_16605 [Solirubrobacteraceae bacterium]|nr:hypothetical protein [Solirubrobacteraceae bacterium]